MTRQLFALLALALLANAVIAFYFGQRKAIAAQLARENRAMVPVVSVVGILFGLFTGFASSDINQRASSLQLAFEREASAARSLLSITAGVGPAAEPIRLGVLDYLQTVETTERKWFLAGAKGTPPADDPAYGLILATTVFAQDAKVQSAIKSLLMSRVDELVRSRIERLGRMNRHGDIMLWAALALMAAVTQATGGIALSGARFQAKVFLASYTVVALLALGYLAWADKTLGSGPVDEQATAFATIRSRNE